MKEKIHFHPRSFSFKILGFDVVNTAVKTSSQPGEGALSGELKFHRSPYVINYLRNKLPHLSSLTTFSF